MSSLPQTNRNFPVSQMKNNDDCLEDLYAYFQDEQQQQSNDDVDVYSGCDYQNEYFDEGRFVEEFPYNEKQEQGGSLSVGFGQYSLVRQSQRAINSQPVSILREYSTKPIFSKTESNQYNTQHISQKQELSNNRSLNALVSASKHRPQKSKKTLSQRSTSTKKSFISKNKILQAQKQKRKNGDNSIEPLFVNPLTSLPTQTMNLEAFEKFYKINSLNLFQKIDQLSKKLSLLGEKTFFKDKVNESQVNEVFQLMGLKNSMKLGKGRALRELKAVHMYMNPSNPQNLSSQFINLGQSSYRLQSSYLSSFKQLLGYAQAKQQQSSNSKQGLQRYGFQKLQRKR